MEGGREKKKIDVMREQKMPLEEIQTLNKQADRSRGDHAEEETMGKAMSPDQAAWH